MPVARFSKVKSCAAAKRGRSCADNVVVHVGTIESLKRFKDDAREVEKGFECGIGLGSFQDIKPKDIIEVFSEETHARKLGAPNA